MPYHYALKIAYKGTKFYGWQKAKEGLSIEGTIENALSIITQQRNISIQAASRTDRGVHALGQVVDFILEKQIDRLDSFQIRLNRFLEPDIACLQIVAIENQLPSFHPTLSAKEKRYRYSINTGPIPSPFHYETSWHISIPLDIDIMKSTAQKFCGTHDFYGFCNQKKKSHYESTVRTVREISIEATQDLGWQIITITVVGNSFLYKMVRNIAGTIAWVGANKIPFEYVEKALQLKNRSFAGITAPASGLALMDITYDIELFP
ncbi:MAG: tRNA pseudouridine(38-40) synthase TruA [Chlamydia sp.]